MGKEGVLRFSWAVWEKSALWRPRTWLCTYCAEVGLEKHADLSRRHKTQGHRRSRQPRGLTSSLLEESTLPMCPDPGSGDHSGNRAA